MVNLMMTRLERDLEGLCERVPQVLSYSLEEATTLRVTLSLLAGEYDVSVLMPDEYPQGEPTELEGFTLLRPGHVDDVCRELANLYLVRESTGGTGSFGSPHDPDAQSASFCADARSVLTYETASRGGGAVHQDEAALDAVLDAEDAEATARFHEDVAFFGRVHGSEHLAVEWCPMRRRHTVHLAAPLGFVSTFHAAALNLHPAKRLVATLGFGAKYDSAQDVPTVLKVYFIDAGSDLAAAASSSAAAGDEGSDVVRWLIKNRLDAALRLNWMHLKEQRAAAERDGGADPEGRGSFDPEEDREYTARRKAALEVEEAEAAKLHATLAPKPAPPRPSFTTTGPDDNDRLFGHVAVTAADDADLEERVGMVRAMGWGRAQALYALAQTELRVEKALAVVGEPLAAHRASLKDEAHWLHKCRLLKKKDVFLTRMMPEGGRGAAAETPGFNAPHVLRFASKYENFFEGGNVHLLNGIYRYIQHRLRTLTRQCVICDRYLGYTGVKPAVCDRATCGFSLEQFGLGCDPVAELRRHPDVVDWLLNFTATAVSRSKCCTRDSFNPWCEHVEVTDPVTEKVESFHTQQSEGNPVVRGGAAPPTAGNQSAPLPSDAKERKDFAKLEQVVKSIPAVSDLAACRTAGELKAKLDKGSHVLAYPLLQWVLRSTRAHLMKLADEHRFAHLNGHQYVVCASNPEKERRFRRRRDIVREKGLSDSGSFWAWHGSGPGNWHAILRTGLKNYSNTNMMSSGAAYGPGIYLARNLSTSLSYMQSEASGWPNSKHGSYRAIALCEVVDERNLDPPSGQKRTMKDHGSIITVEDEDVVHTRFLFIIPKGQRFQDDGSEGRADNIAKPGAILKLFEE